MIAEVGSAGTGTAGGRLRVEMGAHWARLTTELSCAIHSQVLIHACRALDSGPIEQARGAVGWAIQALVVGIAVLVGFGALLALEGRPVQN